MSVSADIEKAIEEIAASARPLEDQPGGLGALIIEANKRLAALNPRTEAWVDSGIGRTGFGFAQVPDHESPTKTTWELAFDIENLGRSIESLLTAPSVVQLAAIERLPYLLKASRERAELDREISPGSVGFLRSLRERPWLFVQSLRRKGYMATV